MADPGKRVAAWFIDAAFFIFVFAVMLTVSAETPVARPAVLIVATQELDDFQVAWLVTSLVLEA